MPTDYLRTAAQCPAVQVASTWLWSKSDPAVANVLFQLTGAQMTHRFDSNASAVEAVSRAGAGGYGVYRGLDYYATGTANLLGVTRGQAVIDGPVTLDNAGATDPGGTHAGVSSQRNYVWLSRGGTVNVRSDADSPNHLLPPDSLVPWVFLYSIVLDGSGNPSGNPDYSGRVTIGPSGLERQTYDLGPPSDTPNANLRFLTRTRDGAWRWNGTAYVLVEGWPITQDPNIGVGEVGYLPAGYQRVVSSVTVDGILQVDGLLTFA